MPDEEGAGDGDRGGAGGAEVPLARSSELMLDLSPKELNLGPKINVLVSLVYPTDKKSMATPAARDAIAKTWDQVAAFYDQASFGMKSICATVTDWRPLSGDAKAYITNHGADGSNFLNDREALARFASEAAQAAQLYLRGLDEKSPVEKSLENYQILIGVINLDGNVEDGVAMDPLRGYADRSAFRFKYDQDQPVPVHIDIPLPRWPMGIIAVDEQADWGRCAHELGHFLLTVPTKPEDPRSVAAFDQEDLYDDREGCADSSASGFDLMGHHPATPLFSGYNMEQLGFYPDDRIEKIAWDSDRYSEEFDVVAHGVSPEEVAGHPDWRYLLKISVLDHLLYYVETRQRARDGYPQLFDPQINVGDAYNFQLSSDENWGGVVVTRVLKDAPKTSQQMRCITVKHDPCKAARAGHREPHTLSAGQMARDLACGLTVQVLGKPLHSRPMVCRVRVSWDKNKAVGFKPLALKETLGGLGGLGGLWGSYNFSIRPRPENGENWECPDMWIEREPFFKVGEEEPCTHPWDFGWDKAEKRPRFGGDRPVPGKRHRVWVRIRCDNTSGSPGAAGAPEVRDVTVVLCDLQKPYKGDVPNEIGRTICNLKKGDDTDVCVPGPPGENYWQPESLNTVLLMVEVNPEQEGDEAFFGDNVGQLLIYDKECRYAIPAAGEEIRPPADFTFKVPVYNPADSKSDRVWLACDVAHGAGLAGGGAGESGADLFEISLPRYALLGPGEMGSVAMKVSPLPDFVNRVNGGSKHTRVRVLQYMLDPGPRGATDGVRSVPQVPIWGQTYWISLKQAVKLSLAVDPGESRPNALVLKGSITPATGAVERCVIDLAGGNDGLELNRFAETGMDGGFRAVFENLPPGDYYAKAAIVRSKNAAQTESELVRLKINDRREIVL